ncbi:prolyl-tRNA synthetase associated domain-containing protein [Fulvimarina sp. 2208YS6-2-32]|uniref:Prolyl-tRNA synthetase associated domain-containing protein n=1 Tax=Fulvimarina uroteuthidis TaxID=3098149 RepID=A0ABU5I1B2_9HYPH|nr:prolyl-tRNA synthetase associated domain-containing protein [Fulvimarina sp. 2208YS6-2-32]MDY8109159.1 prolyl-tRNA synthetase associated domain-containing protein [Fulvimarina sp. 2208YS6-2-32]
MAVTRDGLMAFFAEHGIETRTYDHPALFTVEESRSTRPDMPGAHTKNLFLKDKKGRYFLVVAREETDIALKSLHRKIGGAGRLSFAGPEAMAALLGVEPGSVTAFGVVNDRERIVTVVLDESLANSDIVNAHPLTNTATTAIRHDDLTRFFRLTGHDFLVTTLGDDDQTPSNETSAR